MCMTSGHAAAGECAAAVWLPSFRAQLHWARFANATNFNSSEYLQMATACGVHVLEAGDEPPLLIVKRKLQAPDSTATLQTILQAVHDHTKAVGKKRCE